MRLECGSVDTKPVSTSVTCGHMLRQPALRGCPCFQPSSEVECSCHNDQHDLVHVSLAQACHDGRQVRLVNVNDALRTLRAACEKRSACQALSLWKRSVDLLRMPAEGSGAQSLSLL